MPLAHDKGDDGVSHLRQTKLPANSSPPSRTPRPYAAPAADRLHDQLLQRRPHVSNVNLPNRGQVAGLPLGAIVESNARFSGLGIQPLFAGQLPAGVELLVRPHAERQAALLAAVLRLSGGTIFSNSSFPIPSSRRSARTGRCACSVKWSRRLRGSCLKQLWEYPADGWPKSIPRAGRNRVIVKSRRARIAEPVDKGSSQDRL